MPSLQLVANPIPATIPDAAARSRALDITQSFLVEAPAGSGKTGLLIQRFLKLLASESVDDPRQVLAITFTRKATSEMLDRVFAQLTAAATPGAPSQTASSFEVGLHDLATAVLARDAQRGWNLLDNPSRLNIRTIDSLSQEIASALPILSGSGGAQSPTDNPGPLFAEAARRTVMLLGGDPMLTAALETLLLHRDGNLADCQDLIAAMLATRDQWGSLVPLTQPHLDDVYLDETVLPKLDRALELAICRALTSLTRLFPAATLERLTHLAADMGSLDGYRGTASPIAICAGTHESPGDKAHHLAHWRALIHLLVKPSPPRDFRRSVSANHIGFDILKHHQVDLKQIVAEIGDEPALLQALCEIDSLPPAQYPRDQWPVTKVLFRVLAQALTELQLVFAEAGECDFSEVGLLARTALRNDSAIDDLAASSGSRLQHLLIDEMQDTSTGQYEFIQLLTRRWDGHGQTVFLVGDPKQSIYMFRQARVERFLSTLRTRQLGDIPLTTLRLTSNFRSQPQLVESFNADFTAIFPGAPSPSASSIEVGSNDIPYTPATAIRTGSGTRSWHADPIPADGELDPNLHPSLIRDRIQAWRAKPLPAGRTKPWSIAVLVRNRSHLGNIVGTLKQTPAIPYRAVDIDSLADRAEILDLLALTRALLHPADRTAWLALLHSPVCGLSLADLHRLAAAGPERTIYELMEVRGADLSADGIVRLQPFWRIIAEALAKRGSVRLSQWVFQTWRAFDYSSYLASDALANAEAFFGLLDKVEESGPALDLTRLSEQVAKLYAAPSAEPNAVDLMTLHKAKGLEWDVVLVPELHRLGGRNRPPLLSWLEADPEDLTDDSIAAGILAPISSKGVGAGQLNTWMRSVAATREAAERKRLFYVASTRAREELHLFATPRRLKSGEIRPVSGSLLHTAWAAAAPHFDAPILEMPQPERPVILPSIAASGLRTIQRIRQLPLSTLPSSVSPLPFPSFPRPEGSFSSRSLGNTLHTFLDLLAARLAATATSTQLLAELPTWQPRIASVLRASGLSAAEIGAHTSSVVRGLSNSLNDSIGQWLLSPNPEAASESSFTSAGDGLATFRLDRTFLAGPTPLSTGISHRWIVDYKTADHGAENIEAFLDAQRAQYAPQLETYARQLASTIQQPIQLALFYPMLSRIIYWSHEVASTEVR